MSISQMDRPRFYEGQYLGARDLAAVVEHGQVQMARHLLGGHTWGIAMGLQLMEEPVPEGGDEVDVYLLPGYAWDGFGRPIVVLAPYRLPPEPFSRYDSGEGRPIEVWLRYDETSMRGPLPGFEACETEDPFSRVRETFRLEVGPRSLHKDQHDEISVAGYRVDAQEARQVINSADPPVYDESIPHQAFPGDEEGARWLVPLGHVGWKPSSSPGEPGHFVGLTGDDRQESRRMRRYIGVIVEGVQAADGIIRMRKRGDDPAPLPWSEDLVWVEGSLRVEKDVNLHGGRLSFLKDKGESHGVPLAMRRVGSSIRVQIGVEEGNANNRFSVGPDPDDPEGEFKARLTVHANGNVGIGAHADHHTLQIGNGDTPVSLSLRGPDGNRQSGAIAFEEGSSDRWFKIIHDTEGNHLKLTSEVVDTIIAFGRQDGYVGIGTSEPSALLTLGTPQETRLEMGPTSAALPWNSGTINPGSFVINQQSAGSSAEGADFALMRDGKKRLVLGDTDTILSSQGKGNLRFWVSHDETSGREVACITGTGNVGIGTPDPAQKLHVMGDRIRLENNGKILDMRADGSAVDLQSETHNLYIRSVGHHVIINPDPGDGWVGIKRTDPGYPLHVNGDAAKPGGGSWTSASDERLKANIQPLEGALSRLVSLRGVSFEWKEPEKHGNLTGEQIGLIAQEVEQVFPDWVGTNLDGFKDLTIRGFEALTVEAFKELKSELEELRTRVEDLAASGQDPDNSRGEA